MFADVCTARNPKHGERSASVFPVSNRESRADRETCEVGVTSKDVVRDNLGLDISPLESRCALSHIPNTEVSQCRRAQQSQSETASSSHRTSSNRIPGIGNDSTRTRSRSFSAPFTPCVEIGWRLAREAWGHGYATEAAREACRIGFEEVGLTELVSFTVPANVRSLRVMERLGMAHAIDHDFEHPLLSAGHPLRHHVLYRLSKERWLAMQQP